MSRVYPRDELVARLIREAWILKIRLMSARLQLEAALASRIHIENAQLQLRFATECIVQLCLVAAEIDREEIESGLREKRGVASVLNKLRRRNKLLFPRPAELKRSSGESASQPAIWHLDVGEFSTADVARLGNISQRCGGTLHSRSFVANWPSTSEDAQRQLLDQYRSIRADHVWLWNRFWQHALELKGMLVLLSLDDSTRTTRPLAVFEQGLSAVDIAVDFEPEYLADFAQPVTWKQPLE